VFRRERSIRSEDKEKGREKKKRELRTPLCVMVSGYVSGYLNECWKKYSETAPMFSFLKGKGHTNGSPLEAVKAQATQQRAGKERIHPTTGGVSEVTFHILRAAGYLANQGFMRAACCGGTLLPSPGP